MARVAIVFLKIFTPAGVGEFVEGRNLPVWMNLQGVTDEVTADKTSSARNKDTNHLFGPSRKAVFRELPTGIRPGHHSDRARSER